MALLKRKRSLPRKLLNTRLLFMSNLEDELDFEPEGIEDINENTQNTFAKEGFENENFPNISPGSGINCQYSNQYISTMSTCSEDSYIQPYIPSYNSELVSHSSTSSTQAVGQSLTGSDYEDKYTFIDSESEEENLTDEVQEENETSAASSESDGEDEMHESCVTNGDHHGSGPNMIIESQNFDEDSRSQIEDNLVCSDSNSNQSSESQLDDTFHITNMESFKNNSNKQEKIKASHSFFNGCNIKMFNNVITISKSIKPICKRKKWLTRFKNSWPSIIHICSTDKIFQFATMTDYNLETDSSVTSSTEINSSDIPLVPLNNFKLPLPHFKIHNELAKKRNITLDIDIDEKEDILSIMGSTTIEEFEEKDEEISMESYSSKNSDIHDNVQNVANWFKSQNKIEKRINFSDVPEILKGICFYKFFNKKCNKRNCFRSHTIPLKIIENLQNCSKNNLIDTYNFVVKQDVLYNSLFNNFIEIFAKNKMVNSLIQMVVDIFEQRGSKHVIPFIEKIFDGILECGYSQERSLDLIITEIGVEKYPYITDIFLKFISQRIDLSQLKWDVIEKFIVGRTEKLDASVINTILFKCMTLPINTNLCLNISEHIIRKNLISIHEITPDVAIPLSMITNSGVLQQARNHATVEENGLDENINSTNYAHSRTSPSNYTNQSTSSKSSCSSPETHATYDETQGRPYCSPEPFDFELNGSEYSYNEVLQENINNKFNNDRWQLNMKEFQSTWEENLNEDKTASINSADSERWQFFNSQTDSAWTKNIGDNGSYATKNSGNEKWHSNVRDYQPTYETNLVENVHKSRTSEENDRWQSHIGDSQKSWTTNLDLHQSNSADHGINVFSSQLLHSSHQQVFSANKQNNISSKRKIELKMPIFGFPKINSCYDVNASIHINYAPYQIIKADTTLFTRDDALELKCAVENANGELFLSLMEKNKCPELILGFIPMLLVNLKLQFSIEDSLFGLLDSMKKVNRNFMEDRYLKAMLEITALNLLIELEKKGLWQVACQILYYFNDWDSLITSRIFGNVRYSLMGRYLYIAKIFVNSENFHAAYEILENHRLRLLDNPETWPLQNVSADIKVRDQILYNFFTKGYLKHITAVCDMYRRTILVKKIYGYDALKHLNPMIIDIINRNKIDILKHIVRDINMYYKFLSKDILRALTVVMFKDLSENEIFDLFKKCVERFVYCNYVGFEETIIIRNNFFDCEIYLILKSYFIGMKEKGYKPRFLNIEIKLPENVEDVEILLLRNCRSFFDIFQSVVNLLRKKFDINITTQFSPTIYIPTPFSSNMS